MNVLATAVEDASLATSVWCRSRDCRRRVTLGALAIVAGAAGAVVLTLPLPLALTLTFVTVVGVGGRKERGHLWTRQFLLWWVWR
jgi:ABC-type Co2+ transport system permease subunit